MTSRTVISNLKNGLVLSLLSEDFTSEKNFRPRLARLLLYSVNSVLDILNDFWLKLDFVRYASMHHKLTFHFILNKSSIWV
jgi:hypothetical protein